MRWGLAACCLIAVAGCSRTTGRDGTSRPAPGSIASPLPAPAGVASPDAIGLATAARVVDDAVEELEVDGDLPIFVVRGARPGAPAVFLTGSCTTPVTYVRAFRRAAASHGGIVALQGDKLCRDGTRRWSPDTFGTAERIDAALRTAGFGDPSEVTLVGYSQGAERAEWLAHRFPGKYTRFVLMAGPVVPSPSRFEGARAVVTLAGYGDVRENMADGAKRLRRGAIPAIYMELPDGTQHGELAPAADATVARAFDWLDAHAREPGAVTPPRNRGPRARGRPARLPCAGRCSPRTAGPTSRFVWPSSRRSRRPEP